LETSASKKNKTNIGFRGIFTNFHDPINLERIYFLVPRIHPEDIGSEVSSYGLIATAQGSLD